MRNIAFLAITVALALVAAFMIAMLGVDWLDESIGHGLHPGIAFPAATLLVNYAAWGFWKILDIDTTDCIEDELDRIMVRKY